MELNINHPTIRFTHHLSVPLNDRIIFSGPFGTGKTYFLEKYFDGNPNYNVIHLFPVNYSVASNEDIFELIKYDILFELFGKDVDFDQIEIPHIKFLKQFAAKNAHHILAPFLNLIPEIGKSLYTIYEKLQALGEKYFEEYDGANKDDKKSVIDYLGEFTKTKGSIFEEDFYTQLICQLIDQLKVEVDVDKKCETVLIIDDLDRIDPDHIFRILNVLSAHFDKKSDSNNKFNFDKIILVFDQQNVYNIFQNKYGLNVDFSGYIDKFYSHKIFNFSNNDSLSFRINEILKTIKRPDNNHFLNIHSENSLFYQNIYYIIKGLINANQITIRRLLKIVHKPFLRERFIPRLSGTNTLYNNYNIEIFYIIEFLLHIYGSFDEAIKAISFCKEFEDHFINKEMRIRFVSFAVVLLDSSNHRFNLRLTEAEYEHFESNQLFIYNTQSWHDDMTSFLTLVQKVFTLDSSPRKIVEEVNYFKLLSSSIKMVKDENLLVFSE
jgi:hypothetical protein